MTDQSLAIATLANALRWTTPELMLAFGGVVILLMEALAGPAIRKRLEPLIALLVVGIAFLTNAGLHLMTAPVDVHLMVFGDMIAIDATTGLLRAFILGALFLGYCFTLRRQVWTAVRAEYYSLTLFAAMGAIIMVQAGHLLMLVMGLEILSLPLYTLAALRKGSAHSREAGLKYFVLGSVASAFLVFGVALIYAGAGSAGYEQLYVAHLDAGLFCVGAVMVLAALLFKGGLMPFYVWSPDVYDGAPDAMVGLMAALAKVGAFGALVRLVPPLISGTGGAIVPVLIVIAALTMFFGNLLALAQTNLKRLLAYSSVAHAGYLLVGVLALGQGSSYGLAQSAILFYMGTYLATIIAAFALVALLEGPKDKRWELSDLRGLASTNPGWCFTFAVLLFSLAGIPPLAGFFGKAYVFHAAVGAGYGALAVFGVLCSVLSVYYYLRPIVAMYFEQGEHPPMIEHTAPGVRFATRLVVIYLLVLGLMPALLYNPAAKAALTAGRPLPFPGPASPDFQVREAQRALMAVPDLPPVP